MMMPNVCAAGGGRDYLYGDAGSNYLYGGSGTCWLYGTRGYYYMDWGGGCMDW